MSRKKIKKKVSKNYSDVKYNSPIIEKFINMIMQDGKKSIAMNIVYSSLKNLEDKTQTNSFEVFEKVIEKARPLLEVKSKRIGGANYQIPIEVDNKRSVTLAMRWIISFSRKRSGHSMIEKLTNEMMDILNDKGATLKKREDTHKMAEANKAFAHYNW